MLLLCSSNNINYIAELQFNFIYFQSQVKRCEITQYRCFAKTKHVQII